MTGKKLIYVLISLIIFLLILFWLRGQPGLKEEISVEKPSELKPIERPTEKLAIEPKASLMLISSQNEYNLGDSILVEIYLDSQGNLVDGVDVILKYQPQYLSLKFQEAEFLDKSGSVFKSFPAPMVDQKKGQIVFSALTGPGQSFQGQGKVASLWFETQKPGQTEIKFLFKPGSTTDSNVSSYTQPKDILEKVTDLELSIF